MTISTKFNTRNLLIALCLIATNTLFAQTDLTLSFEHTYEAAPFNYGTIYTTENGTGIRFNRVQYYLSGFEITHDGGTVTPMPDSYVLASGNISNYSIGSEAVTSLEGIRFDFWMANVSFIKPRKPTFLTQKSQPSIQTAKLIILSFI